MELRKYYIKFLPSVKELLQLKIRLNVADDNFAV